MQYDEQMFDTWNYQLKKPLLKTKNKKVICLIKEKSRNKHHERILWSNNKNI